MGTVRSESEDDVVALASQGGQVRTNNRSPKWWRRGMAAAGIVCLTSVSVAALVATPAPADTPGFTGTAQATAQSFKVNPTASALSVGFTFGQSLAGYT